MSLRLAPSGATLSIFSPGSPFRPRILMSFHCPTPGRTSSFLDRGAASPGQATLAKISVKPFSKSSATARSSSSPP
eukprot:1524761-Alexandrium_andersonii.AAC.1